MSTPPRMKEGSRKRPADAAPTGYASKGGQSAPRPVAAPAPELPKRPPLVERLPDMTDGDLVLLQTNAVRIMNTPGHPKRASAEGALPAIEAEIGRRTVAQEEVRKSAAETRAAAQKVQRATAAAARSAKGPAAPKS
jgi:hypothetical protein